MLYEAQIRASMTLLCHASNWGPPGDYIGHRRCNVLLPLRAKYLVNRSRLLYASSTAEFYYRSASLICIVLGVSLFRLLFFQHFYLYSAGIVSIGVSFCFLPGQCKKPSRRCCFLFFGMYRMCDLLVPTRSWSWDSVAVIAIVSGVWPLAPCSFIPNCVHWDMQIGRSIGWTLIDPTAFENVV